MRCLGPLLGLEEAGRKSCAHQLQSIVCDCFVSNLVQISINWEANLSICFRDRRAAPLSKLHNYFQRLVFSEVRGWISWPRNAGLSPRMSYL